MKFHRDHPGGQYAPFEKSSIEWVLHWHDGMESLLRCFKLSQQIRARIITKKPDCRFPSGLPEIKPLQSRHREAKPNNAKQNSYSEEKPFLAPLPCEKSRWSAQRPLRHLYHMGVEKSGSALQQNARPNSCKAHLRKTGTMIWERAKWHRLSVPWLPYSERSRSLRKTLLRQDTIDVR